MLLFDSDSARNGAVYHENLAYMVGKVVAILSFGGTDGLGQARKLRERGIELVVGVRDGGDRHHWDREGFPVYSLWEAVERGDIIQVW